MKRVMAPKKLITSDNETWELFHTDTSIEYSHILSYRPEGATHGMVLRPSVIEQEFSRKGRTEPNQKIINQGRWECGPAALAMLLGESLWDVKRAMVHSGWNNDDAGCGDEQIILGAQKLGYELQATLEPDGNPCLLTVPSLNYRNKSHALCFNGKEMLDPNWGFKGRLWYGSEWGLDTVLRYKRVITFKKFGCSEIPKSKKKISLKKIKRDILDQLLSKSSEDLIEDLFPSNE